MRHIRSLEQAFDLLGTIRDIAYESSTYHWDVARPATLYLDAEYADISLKRGGGKEVTGQVRLRASFGWTLASEQDAAGVYLVLRRKPVIGNVGTARLAFTLPQGIHISLRLRECRLRLDGFDGDLELPIAMTS